MEDALIGLGGNLGDREASLGAALRALATEPGLTVVAVSGLYETEPVGGPAQGRFLNACALVRTRLGPRELLDRLRAVEAIGGRERRVADGPRTIDLDLLLAGDRVIDEHGLQVPHPRMLERAFVLVPAGEIAPDMIHPLSGRTLKQHLTDLGTIRGVAPFRRQDWWRPIAGADP